MKKYLLLLLATCCLVACEDKEPAIDYSAYTLEEILAMDGGLDYLLATYGEVDENTLNEMLQTRVLIDEQISYALIDGKWSYWFYTPIDGFCYYYNPEPGKLRWGDTVGCRYLEWEDNQPTAIDALKNFNDIMWGTTTEIVAMKENIIFIKHTGSSRITLQIYTLEDKKEEIMQRNDENGSTYSPEHAALVKALSGH